MKEITINSVSESMKEAIIGEIKKMGLVFSDSNFGVRITLVLGSGRRPQARKSRKSRPRTKAEDEKARVEGRSSEIASEKSREKR